MRGLKWTYRAPVAATHIHCSLNKKNEWTFMGCWLGCPEAECPLNHLEVSVMSHPGSQRNMIMPHKQNSTTKGKNIYFFLSSTSIFFQKSIQDTIQKTFKKIINFRYAGHPHRQNVKFSLISLSKYRISSQKM